MTICTHGGPRRSATPARPAILALALAALPPTVALGAASAANVGYGTPATFLSPQIQAMAGTGAALYRGGFSAVLNPAFLVLEPGVRADVAGALDQVHEDRFVPLFDSFESYVTETAIATNRQSFWAAGFGLAARVPRAPYDLSLGLALTDRYDYAYKFEEELRNPSPFDVAHRDELLEDREVTVDGALRALSLGVGASPAPYLSLGASLCYSFGSREEFLGRRFYQEPDSSRTGRAEYDLSGVNFVLGVRGRVGDRLEVGLAHETQLRVDVDAWAQLTSYERPESAEPVLVIEEATGESEVVYPRRWRAGLAFFPRSDPRTVLAAEAELAEWSRLADDALPNGGRPRPRLKDALDVRVGVEHRFYNETAARFGFRHLDEYADREAGISMFTGGLGLPLAGGELGLSVELAKTESVLDHWFPYPDIEIDGNRYVSDDQARVETTQVRFGFGFTRAF